MNEEHYDHAEECGIRINKYLSSCGIDSRRVADRLIAEGRVEVNGRVVDAPGLKVTDKDFIKVDGRHVKPMEEVVVLLNKPRGYVCSREAQGAIGTVYDLLPPRLRHLNYVGRLDADSEGLLIMTNNGELNQTLTLPSCGIEKEYWVTVDQNFDNSVLLQFLRGVRIPEGNAKAKYVCRASARRACIVLQQGLKRQVRQMFQCLGLRVRKLVRVRIGSLWGGDLEPGSWRFLEASDLELLMKNPPRPRKYVAAAQLAVGDFPAKENKPEDDDDSYVFNPDDFEKGETYEPTPEMRTRFVEIDENDEPDDIRRPVRGGFERCERKFGGGFGGRREGGFKSDRGGFGGRRKGGFKSDRGGFGGRREGGFRGEDRERRFGDRAPREDRGGFGRRERRSDDFRSRDRDGAREGGFRREGGFGGRREGGFKSDRGGFGARREGGFKSDRGGFGGRRDSKPRRSGSEGGAFSRFSRGGRNR